MNKFSIAYLFLFLLFTGDSKAQVTVKKYNWRTSTGLTEIPDSLKNEDAIMISVDHAISNSVIDQYRGKLQSIEWYYVRIKFITNAGVERYSKFHLSHSQNQSFEILDARTLKPGNKIVDLTNEDLNQVKYNYKTKGADEIDREVSFSMPGVEAGDEVEFCYRLISDHITLGKDVFLFSYLPCLHSTFTYTSDKNIRSEVKDLSTMPVPIVEQNANERIYKWEMKNLPGIGSEENSIPALTMPYVSIVIRMVQLLYGPDATHDENISPATWEGVYESNDYFYSILDNNSKEDSAALSKFIIEKTG